MSQPPTPTPEPQATPPAPDPTIDEYKLADPPAPPATQAPTAPLEAAPPKIATHPSAAAIATLERPRRLAALDVFRGITIAAMVLVNSGSEHAYSWLEHAQWNGWTPADLIFPFFLFIVGVATPFSLAKRSSVATTRGALVGRIWVRALSLILVGHLLSAIYAPPPFHEAVQGFAFTRAFRVFGFVYAWAALLALLIPWRSRRLSTWLPVAIAVVFYGYLVAMHFVRANALQNGWPNDQVPFGGSIKGGGGLFNPDAFRIPGVLVRIGICYGVAATLSLFLGWRSLVGVVLALFIAYSAIMLAVPIHKFGTGERIVGSLDVGDNVARRVDVAVFERWTLDPTSGLPIATQRHTWRDYPDNEGILSTLPAIGSVLIGVLVGRWLRTPRTSVEHAAGLLSLAVPVTILGCVLDVTLMPINKTLWTSSFAVFTAGMAMLGLGFVFYLTDILGRRAWAWPFTVMGMNAIAAFAASTIVPRVCSYILVPDVPRVELRTEPLEPSTATTKLVKPRPAASRPVQKLAVDSVAKKHVLNGVTRASNWLVDVSKGHAPLLATQQNLSLAWSLTFVFAIFLITLLLYVCRIFVKV